MPCLGAPNLTPAQLAERKDGDRRAFRLIMKRGLRKADVVEFAMGLSDEGCEGASDTFYAQGPRLWGFWCQAMMARTNAGEYIPVSFR